MRQFWLQIFWALALCLPAFGTALGGAPGGGELWSGSWHIIGLAPSAQTQSVWADSKFTITFEPEASDGEAAEGRVSGRACNNFFGQFEAAGGNVSMGAMGATRMACAGVVGHMESELLNLLGMGRAAFTWDGETLALDYGEGRYIRLTPSAP